MYACGNIGQNKGNLIVMGSTSGVYERVTKLTLSGILIVLHDKLQTNFQCIKERRYFDTSNIF